MAWNFPFVFCFQKVKDKMQQPNGKTKGGKFMNMDFNADISYNGGGEGSLFI
jgi:hypothetical protein